MQSVVPVALLLGLGLASASPASGGEVGVLCSYYRDTNASLHLFLRNGSSEPVTVLPPMVNGFDCAALNSRTETRARDVLWYRCRPNPIAPGGIADLTITLPARTDKPATIEVRTSVGSMKQVIACAPEAMRFQAIRFSRDLRCIDIYVRWSDVSKTSSLNRILLDGVDVRRQASPWPARAVDGMAYTRVELPKPLVKNSYHVLQVTSESGLSTAYQIRAIPAEFLIGVYGVPTPGNVSDWVEHACNHYLSFGPVAPELIDSMAAGGISTGARYIEELADRTAGKVRIADAESAGIRIAEVKAKPGFLYHHLVDEPDVADYYAGRWLGSTAMELTARDRLCETVDPEHYTFVQLDNTFRPNNYRVYGEVADVLATHRYSLGNYLRSEAGEKTVSRPSFMEDMQESVSALRACTEPKPFFMVTQFFSLGEKRKGRPPTIEEMRLQCYLAVAGGARGLIHYIHSGSTGGGEGGKARPLWDAMTDLHRELARLGETIAVGTPAPEGLVRSSSPNVYASALLCGDRIAVILINRAHRSSVERFTVVPMKSVRVTVRIPPWMEAGRLFVTSAGAAKTITSDLNDAKLSFTADEVRDAECFMIGPCAR